MAETTLPPNGDARLDRIETALAALATNLAEVKQDLAGVAKNVDIEFLTEALRRLQTDADAGRSDFSVMTAMLIRQDTTLRTLLDEVRAMHRQRSQFDARLRALETR